METGYTTTMNATFEINNFLSSSELEKTIENVYDFIDLKHDFINKHGVWQGKDEGTHHWIATDKLSSAFNIVEQKLKSILEPFTIEAAQILQAKLGSDLHTDYAVKRNQQAQKLEGDPYYTLIIPHHDYNSHTVVFEQSADYNDFYLYKEHNQPLENFINNKDWQQYCSHCWPEDQTYLTLDKACSWEKGKLLGFDRRRWHCSDNFDVDLKEGFILWLRKHVAV